MYGNNDTIHDVHVADMYKHKDLAVDGLYGKRQCTHGRHFQT